MNEGFVFDVFLSHNSRDKHFITVVPERWRKDGLKAWFDEWVLKSSDIVPARTEDGPEQLCALAFCVSAWAQMADGTFRFRDPLNQVPRFIPLRLDNARVKGTLAQLLHE